MMTETMAPGLEEDTVEVLEEQLVQAWADLGTLREQHAAAMARLEAEYALVLQRMQGLFEALAIESMAKNIENIGLRRDLARAREDNMRLEASLQRSRRDWREFRPRRPRRPQRRADQTPVAVYTRDDGSG